jgi:serine/threonine protein kinase
LDKSLKEVKFLAKLRNIHVIRYHSTWIEKHNNLFTLFIQMEYCFSTLEGVSKILQKEIPRNPDVLMEPIEYFTCSELFKEILEGVHFLHSSNPQIIHRDLKPKNILITDGIYNGFVRIADFGIVKTHKREEQLNTVNLGTPRYMAQELRTDSTHYTYDTKVDIYSLGVIAEDLFGLYVNE